MLTRRQTILRFGSILVAVPAARFLSACGSEPERADAGVTDRRAADRAVADRGAADAGPDEGAMDAAPQPDAVTPDAPAPDAKADAADAKVPDAKVATLTFVSSVVNGHSHSVDLSTKVVMNPPVGGTTLTTSVEQAHTHMVTLTEEDLDAIESGMSVSKDTTVAQNHNHTFVFSTSA